MSIPQFNARRSACAVEPCVAALPKAMQGESTPMAKKWFDNAGDQPFPGLVTQGVC